MLTIQEIEKRLEILSANRMNYPDHNIDDSDILDILEAFCHILNCHEESISILEDNVNR